MNCFHPCLNSSKGTLWFRHSFLAGGQKQKLKAKKETKTKWWGRLFFLVMTLTEMIKIKRGNILLLHPSLHLANFSFSLESFSILHSSYWVMWEKEDEELLPPPASSSRLLIPISAPANVWSSFELSMRLNSRTTCSCSSSRRANSSRRCWTSSLWRKAAEKYSSKFTTSPQRVLDLASVSVYDMLLEITCRTCKQWSGAKGGKRRTRFVPRVRTRRNAAVAKRDSPDPLPTSFRLVCLRIRSEQKLFQAAKNPSRIESLKANHCKHQETLNSTLLPL